MPGQTFLALRGEHFDGHAYTREAVRARREALIVEDPDAAVAGTTTLVVEETLAGLSCDLAGAARAHFRGRVLAITGSAGKTTTKAFAAQLLSVRYGDRILASPANENNEIGVSKLLLAADNDEHDLLVIEMGARHYGDIETLVRAARPDIGILTNVGDAHLEIMGSRERLEETKWALFCDRRARDPQRARRHLDSNARRRSAKPSHWFFAGEVGGDIPMHGRVSAISGAQQWLEIDGDRDDNVLDRRARSRLAQSRQSRRCDRRSASSTASIRVRSSRRFRKSNCPAGATSASRFRAAWS